MKKIFLFWPIFLLALTGCTISIKTGGGLDGGVFRSEDLGESWRQVTLVYRGDELEKTFSTVDLTAMAMDPSDNRAIYIGTAEHGAYYTFDGGYGWQQTLANLGRINDIVVSPKERCIIYAAIGNRVYKTTDCNRHWSYQLIETR